MSLGSLELATFGFVLLSDASEALITLLAASVKRVPLLSTAVPVAVAELFNTPVSSEASNSRVKPITNESPLARRLVETDWSMRSVADVPSQPSSLSAMLLLTLVGGAESVRPLTFWRTPGPSCVSRSWATLTSARSKAPLFSTTS